jgi:NADH:ubiquinone oxidoreductase subunit 3 (subunit A)
MIFNLYQLDNIYIYDIFFQIMLYILFSLILGLIIISISYIFAIQNPYIEKISAYECGFEPFEDARNEFNVSFYIVAILFIIFDVEVIYLFPWCLTLNYIGFFGIWSMIFFIILLSIGFIYEIINGALNWP